PVLFECHDQVVPYFQKYAFVSCNFLPSCLYFQRVEQAVVQAFDEAGIETKVVNRLEYCDALIAWADAVVTTGGDGTYLLAASRIRDRSKPVIGFNSDPTRSKGQLCLPEKYSASPRTAVAQLRRGLFRWQYRSRIRVTLRGEHIYQAPIELHDQQLLNPEYRYLDIDANLKSEHVRHSLSEWGQADPSLPTRVLPVLALNEVFIGECISARVSYLELQFDDQAPGKHKCSGLIVSTGTGSTSWTYNVNKLTEQNLEQDQESFTLKMIKGHFTLTRIVVHFTLTKITRNISLTNIKGHFNLKTIMKPFILTKIRGFYTFTKIKGRFTLTKIMQLFILTKIRGLFILTKIINTSLCGRS
ncbi:NAD kinase 2, mitochondrial, partial [Hyalella azteca]|uniref:NAD(+) kinase n=1 Tax=Hyalella azteca TaxID=294128 RepID=A0A8B7P3E1_HYAAZ